MDDLPIARLIGADNNIFNLLGIARRAIIDDERLEDCDRAEAERDAAEMLTRVAVCSSYDESLIIISEYVEIE